MPCVKMEYPSTRSNLLLTVPDRLGNGEISSDEDARRKTQLCQWIGQYIGNTAKLRCVREVYPNAKKQWTHHYHVGVIFPKPTKWKKLWNAKNVTEVYYGIDFRAALVKKGATADQIFEAYFANPSKYKPIDEHGALVCEVEPRPRKRTQPWRKTDSPATRLSAMDDMIAWYASEPAPIPMKVHRLTTPAFERG